MKVYFTASLSAKSEYLHFYKDIVTYLSSKGCEVQANQILNATEQMVAEMPKEKRLHFHEQVISWIHDCDFMVAELSHPSTSVGYEISLALRSGKAVLILYSKGDPPSLFAVHKDEKIVIENYNKENLNKKIDNFIDFVTLHHDLRFTFFITPRIARYLDDISKSLKTPKSVYLRRLIEEDMAKQSV